MDNNTRPLRVNFGSESDTLEAEEALDKDLYDLAVRHGLQSAALVGRRNQRLIVRIAALTPGDLAAAPIVGAAIRKAVTEVRPAILQAMADQ